jgi:hypothetical protein
VRERGVVGGDDGAREGVRARVGEEADVRGGDDRRASSFSDP